MWTEVLCQPNWSFVTFMDGIRESVYPSTMESLLYAITNGSGVDASYNKLFIQYFNQNEPWTYICQLTIHQKVIKGIFEDQYGVKEKLLEYSGNW